MTTAPSTDVAPTTILASPALRAPKLIEKHIPALDGVRGLAIILVMLHHFVQGLWHANPFAGMLFRVAAAGWSGVDLFFVLSGFLITGILYDAKGSQSYFKNFYARRTLRIFPLYYGVLFVAFILPLFFRLHAAGSTEQFWLWTYASNIYPLFHQGDWVGGDNALRLSFTNFWSLAVEEHFYLMWPLLISHLSRTRAMAICVILAVIALALREFFTLQYPDTVGRGLSLPYIFTPCRMDALAIGAFVALASRGPRGLSPLIFPARCLCLAIAPFLLAGFIYDALDRNDPLVATAGYTYLPLFFASALVLILHSSPHSLAQRFFSSKTMAFFGRYSYGMYVFHGLLLYWFDRYFSVLSLMKWNGHYFLNVLLHLILGLLITTALAWLSWHGYEKHFLKLKRFFTYNKPAHQTA